MDRKKFFRVLFKYIKKELQIFAGAILVGLLWIITSIPIVTFGAATAAAYHTMVRTVVHRRGHIFSIFFEAYGENMLLSLPVQFILALFCLFLCVAGYNLHQYGTEITSLMSYFILFVSVVLWIFQTFLYAIMQKFDQSRGQHCKLALYITFRHLMISVGLVIFLAFSLLIIYFAVWPALIIPGLWWVLVSKVVEPVLESYVYREKTAEDEEEEPQPSGDKNSYSINKARRDTDGNYVYGKNAKGYYMNRDRNSSDTLEDGDDPEEDDGDEMEDEAGDEKTDQGKKSRDKIIKKGRRRRRR